MAQGKAVCVMANVARMLESRRKMRRGNKRGKPRSKIKDRRFTCYTMEIKEKECFKNKEISHVKCFNKIKQELFWF